MQTLSKQLLGSVVMFPNQRPPEENGCAPDHGGIRYANGNFRKASASTVTAELRLPWSPAFSSRWITARTILTVPARAQHYS